MTSRSAITISFLLAASSAYALVRPQGETVLPNFDVRKTSRAVALGGGRSLPDGDGVRVEDLSMTKQAALGRLQVAVGPDLVVRWNASSAIPHMLFSYAGPMTAMDARDPRDIAVSFLVAYGDLFDLAPDAIASFRETKRMQSSDGSLTILHLEQAKDGLSVFHGEARFAVTARGELASVSTGMPAPSLLGVATVPVLSADDAMLKAADAIGVQLSSRLNRINPSSEFVAIYERGPLMKESYLEPVLYPIGLSARLAYKVMLQAAGSSDYYEVVIDATDGSMLHRHNMTQYVATQGLVFKQHPLADGTPSLEDFYDSSVKFDARWPLGWADSNESIGNVADSKDDQAGDDEGPAPFIRSRDARVGVPYVFEDPWTNSYEASGNPTPDLRFVITELFYFANVYHNWMYEFGFDEPGGNWQNSNLGRGGLEIDRVFMDAQNNYPTERNNANMQTPPDGVSPRAQFMLFTAAIGARRDPGVDGDVVLHELTHGLSNRLVGGPTNASCLNTFQGGSMGEGWSDFYALAFYDEPRLGEYATGDLTNGIRSHPYAPAYPACHTYKAWGAGAGFCSPNSCAGLCQPPFCATDCEVHDEGQLWAATLWEMTKLIEIELGGPAFRAEAIRVAVTLTTNGMKLTPCGPTFLDSRDGILLADRYIYDGAYHCVIWEAFKDRWMGFTASTLDGDDLTPAGMNDHDPACLSQGQVVLNLDRYGCTDQLVVTVHDGDASGAVAVQVRSMPTGDTVTIPSLGGIVPTFTSTPVSIVPGPATVDGNLQVNPGDVITATYNDSSPPVAVTDNSDINCLADLEVKVALAGGCSPDSLAGWPVTLPEILDAGEIIDVVVTVVNREPRDLANVAVAISSITGGGGMVVALDPAPVAIGSVPGFNGSGAATLQIAASSFLGTGVATLNFALTADGFTGTLAPVSVTIAVHSDYAQASAVRATDTFEATDGGYVKSIWPGSPFNEWQWGGGCGGAGGSLRSWQAGDPACAGPAGEQDANVESPVFTPITTTRVSWYPTALNFNYKMQLSGQDLGVVAISPPDFLSSFVYKDAQLDSTMNSTTWVPFSAAFTPADTIGAGWDVNAGLIWWFDFFTTNGAAISDYWAIDDLELEYEAADVVAQLTPACATAGYTGTLASCAGGAYTLSLYNTRRPAEMQYSGNGLFWDVGPAWNMFDVEFPTASAAGENLVFLANRNPNDGAHQGVVAVSGQVLTDPSSKPFGTVTCQNIPTPVAPDLVGTGAPVTITWPKIVESGPLASIVGYNVYRVNAETFPPATSTIANYGAPIGNTVGRPILEMYIDTAPALVSPPIDEYTYVVQPLYRCDGPGCSGPVAATFGGDETTAGTANVSTDSWVTDGTTTVAGTMKVSEPLLASFVSYSATRTGDRVVVRWVTSAEIDTIGYHVYRGSAASESGMVRLTPNFIDAEGAFYAYEYTDAAVPAGPLFYQIREMAMPGAGATNTDVFAVMETGSGRVGSGRIRRGSADRTDGLRSPGAERPGSGRSR